MIKLGYAERKLEVPLFTEMYGYGPFSGRRSQGVHDPIYCRAVTFNDNKRRNIIIYTDTCTTDELDARVLRARIADNLKMQPDGIMFAATHTHYAPLLGRGAIGFGEPDPTFQKIWHKAVLEVAFEAAHSEENVFAEAGRAPVTHDIAVNRVNPKKNETDPDIRWIKFIRNNGSSKLLIHNYGMHGTLCGGFKKCSADWIGEVNRLIIERKLAEHPIFLQGASGDINPRMSCNNEGEAALTETGKNYIDDLEKGIASGGEKIELAPVQASLRTIELPTVQQTVEELRREAVNPAVKENMGTHCIRRIEELAIIVERDGKLRRFNDIQLLRMGDIMIYTVPGELFIELGNRIMAKSSVKFPLVSTSTNGSDGYFPTKKVFEAFPSISSKKNGTFGFYEVYTYMSSLKMKYQPNIGDYLINELLKSKPE